MSETQSTNKPTDEEIQAWLDGVHEGSCCADESECQVKIQTS